MKSRVTIRRCAMALALAGIFLPMLAMGADASGPAVDIKINAGDGREWVAAIKVFAMLAFLTVAPSIVMSVTSFTRIIVVLGLMRHAVGVQSLPPSKVIVGTALFLTAFTMGPVWQQISTQALTPYENGEVQGREAAELALGPIRAFMLTHTHATDLELFIGLNTAPEPESVDDIPTLTLVPAFMLSELKTAFQMGAMLFLPFLIIDLVVASVLMSMGMMMLPPVMVSLPIKLFVFVLADGWGLIVQSLAESVMLTAG